MGELMELSGVTSWRHQPQEELEPSKGRELGAWACSNLKVGMVMLTANHFPVHGLMGVEFGAQMLLSSSRLAPEGAADSGSQCAPSALLPSKNYPSMGPLNFRQWAQESWRGSESEQLPDSDSRSNS